MISFALQARLSADLGDFLETARKAEDLGYVAFMVPDHPGTVANPFVSLAAAASVTSDLKLGPYVLNGGIRDPFHIAVDVATLDVVSGGRAFLGIGAGHTPAEWQAVGLNRPSASSRAGRMVEMAPIIQRLLAGETVSHQGDYVSLTETTLSEPRPIQDHIPLLVGGGNTSLLDFASEHADIVGMSGLGRTLADGHAHEARWSHSQIGAQIDRVKASGRNMEIEALVQKVEVTDNRLSVLTAMDDLGLSPEELLDIPYILVGNLDQLEEQVLRHQERWGISRYAVRTGALEQLAPLIARLS